MIDRGSIISTTIQTELEKLKGQFCRRRDGERIFVEVVNPAEGIMPAWVLGRYIDGPNAGTRTRSFVSTLEPLGWEVPKDDPIARV